MIVFIHGWGFCYLMCRRMCQSFLSECIFHFFHSQFLAFFMDFNLSLPVGDTFSAQWNCQLFIGLR